MPHSPPPHSRPSPHSRQSAPKESQRKPQVYKERAAPRPLDAQRMEEMALAYVARFATSAGKLADYLERKLRARGWVAPDGADAEAALPGLDAAGRARIAELVARFVAAGYVNDESFAKARAGSLSRRGYGNRRIAQSLGEAGIDESLRAAALPSAGSARGAALAYARKRGLGPFARSAPKAGADPRALREKQIAAMLRAGHPMESARKLVCAGSIEAAEEWAGELDEDAGFEG